MDRLAAINEALNRTQSAEAFQEAHDKVHSYPLSNIVFVFGSNESGRHGAAAAAAAVSFWGAAYGSGTGLHGRSYAIPTKDRNIVTLPIVKIVKYVDGFKEFAKDNDHMVFILTEVGCGLAGYNPSDIAPMFSPRLDNVVYPTRFLEYV